MAAWPDLDELKRVLNVDSDDHDTTLARIRLAAIHRVKSEIGRWDDDVDEPNENTAHAALRMAELIAERPDARPGSQTWIDLGADPAYQSLLVGQRRHFGIG